MRDITGLIELWLPVLTYDVALHAREVGIFIERTGTQFGVTWTMAVPAEIAARSSVERWVAQEASGPIRSRNSCAPWRGAPVRSGGQYH